MNDKYSNQGEKRYLFLMQSEDEFPEQLNSYMFLIMQVIDLAKKLNMCFVLPHIEIQPRNAELAEKGEQDLEKIILGRKTEPFETFFNFEILKNYIDLISFKEFSIISNNNLDVLCCFGKSQIDTIDSFGETFKIQKSLQLKNIYDLRNINSSIIGITGLKRGHNGVKINPNWHKEIGLDYWKIRKNLIYNDILLNEANNFIAKYLNNKYLAIHWRRSDRNFYGGFSGDFPDSDIEMKKQLLTLIKLIKSKMTKYKLETVFMATDSGTQWHLDFIKDQIPIIRYPSSGKWQDFQKESIIEQIICINSNHFISAPKNYKNCSSFSRWIIDGKILNGDSKNISYRKMDNQESILKRGLRFIKP